jgi:hypothetical protein
MADVFRTGKVARIYAADGLTYIKLDIPEAKQPENGYFQLDKTHSNYNALYSLALVAAVNRKDLQIRTASDVKRTEPAVVLYMVVDWP